MSQINGIPAAASSLEQLLIELTSPDPLIRQRAGKALLSLRTQLTLADADHKGGNLLRAWRNAVRDAFASGSFPAGEVAKKLVRYRMETYAAYVARIGMPRDSAAGPDEALSMASIMAGGVIEAMGPAAVDAVPHLLEMLIADEGRQGYTAASALGSIGPAAKAALPVLLDQIAARGVDESPNRKAIALVAIADNDASDTVSKLIGLLSDPRQSARRGAAAAIGEFGKRATSAAPALTQCTIDADDELRSIALGSLRKIGERSPEVLHAVWARVRDDKWWVRGQALSSIASLEPASEAVLDRLIIALDDNEGDMDWNIRDTAARAIAEYDLKSSRAVPALVRYLLDEEGMVNRWIVAALGAIGHGAIDALPALNNALGAAADDGHALLEQAIAKIME
jgi:HEAT repeat protein